MLRSLRSLTCALGVLVGLTAPGMAQAAPSELFFSEYVEGSSNNKALEIYNGTGADINLGTSGYSVQMFFNGNPSAGLTINLTGTVAAGDVFVLAQASANAAILAQADQTNGSGWFNGDDAVTLRKGATVLDVIGQIGFDPGTEWGTGLTSTADNTLRRKPEIQAGDTAAGDAFDPALEWAGFAVDTFDGLGAHGADAAPSISATSPQAGASGIARDSNVTITFSEPVAVTGDWFSIQCATSGAHTATVSGGPSIYTLDPAVNFAQNELCTVKVFAANVTDVDTIDPPNNMAADATFTFTTVDLAVCGDPATKISAVQGATATTPISGQVVTIEGVVTSDLQGGGQFSGYYVQEEPSDIDTNPATSEGVFVFSSTAVSAGNIVRVRGRATEFGGQTQLDQVSSTIVCPGTLSIPATDVSLPFSVSDAPERYEGMLVRLPQSLVISEYFNYERFGELVLARPVDGESRPFTPTSVVDPGGPALARLLANTLSRITLDDTLNSQNPSVLRHPNGDPFSLSNRFRGGDTVTNTTGVLGFAFNLYRIQPTAPAEYAATNPRPAAPSPVGGSVRAAAMNTLNFFVTGDYASGDPRDNKCGPLQNVECRGWDADETTEFERQRTKLLEALAGLDADVLGLNELENTAGVDALTDPQGIVPGLNAKLGAGTYAAIETGTIGTDAIRVGLIYKSGTVKPVGSFKLLTSAVDPRFIDTKSRPALAQTFEELATGARFTVVVNHLKSKGSGCNDVGDPDAGDGQGNCNGTRTKAAQALVDWLATDPTGSGDADFLIMGDLNSYAKEDPIRTIQAGADDTAGTVDDWTNLVARDLGTYAYSYVFDGMAGYLDHALANASIESQVVGVAEWHINADEPDVLDYDTSFKPPAQEALWEPNGYRTSDHDPVLVGLALRSTFADLSRLTADAVEHKGLENSLLAKLRAAEAAAARGNEVAKRNILAAYVNEVEAQTGKAISAADAERLIRVARSL